ncbi:MAG: hypothetical protein PHY56_08185, partial [Candidatus Omnitrophica bacterium]|nr:hypothetical protein [Candidatus Omnitrophota bacterium]
PLEDCKEGMLVMTTLNAQAMPLIRYALGDITFKLESKCPCGRTSMRIGPISGRGDRLVKIKGVLINPDEISRIIANIDFICGHFMECLKDRYSMDRLIIYIALKKDRISQERAKDYLAGKLKARLRINMEIIIIPLAKIAERINLYKSEKPYHKSINFFDLRKTV